jgi:hypothetical protein
VKHSSIAIQYLEECNVDGLRLLWKEVFPEIPQPTVDYGILCVIHLARTRISSLSFRYRAYSHSWLLERGIPSMLPDRLRPSADRMYPRIVEAVGISVNSKSNIIKPALSMIQKNMSDVVLECYSDKKTDVRFIRQRMNNVRADTMRKLFGTR